MQIFPLLCLAIAVILLISLCVIDLKHRLLPNVLVFPFLCMGLLFHFFTNFSYLTPLNIMAGAAIGAGFLYLIRFIANWHYKTDTLGLGDVKLMGAAGAWLGPEMILIALVVGALAGVAHGAGYAVIIFITQRRWPNFSTLSLPAGPGFAAGIVAAAILMLQNGAKVLF